jgi:two-component system copper resistance phosphate regulon response regulator CusR
VRILVVEDEAQLAENIARGLQEKGHPSDVALTLADARSSLAEREYDAMVLDVRMPDGSGFAFTTDLRNRGETVPILILTARDGVEDRVDGLNRGADDYMVKPFALDELEARLRALRRRQRDVQPGSIEVADLSIDPAAQLVTRAGRHIELTSTECAVLSYLAERAGQVCDRHAIGEHVWGEGHDPDSNIIDVYVLRLRRNIDLPGLPPLIRTVRGAGYSLRIP